MKKELKVSSIPPDLAMRRLREMAQLRNLCLELAAAPRVGPVRRFRKARAK